MKPRAFIFRSIYFSEKGPTRRVLATVNGREFEFVRLTEKSEVEAYDYPKTWHGVPRFIGYLPSDHGKILFALALLKLRAEGRPFIGGVCEFRTQGAP